METQLDRRLKRAHNVLMRHPETALFSGCLMLGDSVISDEPGITAWTDGVNKCYGSIYINAKCEDDAVLRAVVLHENLHVALRHCVHGRRMQQEDPQAAALAADYVVNGIIHQIKDKTLVKLLPDWVFDVKYLDWSMRAVYDDIRANRPPPEEPCDGADEGDGNGSGNEGGTPRPGDGDDESDGDDEGDGKGRGKPGKGKGKPATSGFDQHYFNGDTTAEELREINEKIDRAVREGTMLAGRMGGITPRAITESLVPTVDWREPLREFAVAAMRGNDEYTWRVFRRRQLANDIYLPSVTSETIGEMIVACDTSGSIGSDALNEFGAELASICEMVQPERVRLLWWGSNVVSEQVFEGKDFDGLLGKLRPVGGGGTCASSVSAYILRHEYKADAIVVMTDGYVESNVVWETDIPTLWLVTGNHSWNPPAGGKKVDYTKD